MRFGLVHRAMTNALAVLGILALVLSGELSRWMNVLIVLSLALAIGLPMLRETDEEAWQQNPWVQRLSNVAPVLLLGTELARWFLGRPLLELAVEFAALLQVIRLATRRGAAHDQQVIILALLHLIAGTVLGGNVGYGLCFVGFLIVAPPALVLSHLRREVEGNYRQGARDRTGLPVDVPRILRSRRVVGKRFLLVTCSLSVPILVFTATLFLLFPRVVRPFLSLTRSSGSRSVGFDDRVDLGSHGAIRDDPQIALRVTVPMAEGAVPPERLALYLRGAALDRYDGRAWTRTQTMKHPVAGLQQVVPVERWPDPADRTMIIDREPFEPFVIPLPLDTVAFELIPRGEPNFLSLFAQVRVERGPEGEYRFKNADEHGIRYRVHVSPKKRDGEPRQLSADDRARYLSLPKLPPRIADLAKDWTQGETTPFAKAKKIEHRLRTEYRYDLASPSGGKPQPLDHFLFESKRGHCEFYSTAMAVMLRQEGIPSRNVTGFVGGTWNRFSQTYTVRQGDAHAWVEAYVDGAGWVTFDPTPPADALPRSEIRGLLAMLRDIAEATSQRWDRWVIGYDINQQVSLYEQLRRALQGARPLGVQPSVPWLKIFAGCLGAAAAGYGVYRFLKRRRRSATQTKRAPEGKRAASAALATALYEQLDAAMIAQGIGRPQSLPPLHHAEGAEVTAHPLGAEIRALTELYLSARFGPVVLGESDKLTFERRVKAVRGHSSRSDR